MVTDIDTDADEMRGYVIAGAAKALWVSWYANESEQELCSECENNYPKDPIRDCPRCAWHIGDRQRSCHRMQAIRAGGGRAV